MANLKDTIVLGNLTVTGKVTASELAGSSSNSNRFETIYANKIVGQGSGTYTLEIEALAENNQMKINTGYLDLFGTLRTSNISSSGDINLVTSNEDGSSTVNITCEAIKLHQVSKSPIFGRSSGGLFRFYASGNIGIGDTVGGGISLYPEGTDYSLGTQEDPWKSGYFQDVNASTKVYTPSIQNSGGISLSCGGSISLSATSAGGGYIDLNAKHSIRPNVSIIPSVTTADLGSSGTPFRYIYGTKFYASSDRRLKDNIQLSNLQCYDIINKLQLRDYNWKSDKEKHQQYGLIAQELREALPQELWSQFIAGTENDDDYLSINEGKLVHIALGALQEQIKINKHLEERIQKLERGV